MDESLEKIKIALIAFLGTQAICIIYSVCDDIHKIALALRDTL